MEQISSSIKTCFTILQKVPPKKSGDAIGILKEALASKQEPLQEMIQKLVDLPLRSSEDPGANRKFLQCEFNRHLGSYRSPFSNTYIPAVPGDQLVYLSDSLRTFEQNANEVWDAYTQLYYGKDAVGSVYVKEVAGLSFSACFLVQKDVAEDERLQKGQWNSAHIVYAGKTLQGSTKYKISSTLVIFMDPISARVTREIDETHKVSDPYSFAGHLENIGKMIEKTEIDMRSNLEVVTLPKTLQGLESLRQPPSAVPEGIPIMVALPPTGRIAKTNNNWLPAGAMAMPGMGEAHAAALNAAVLKRASKKS